MGYLGRFFHFYTFLMILVSTHAQAILFDKNGAPIADTEVQSPLLRWDVIDDPASLGLSGIVATYMRKGLTGSGVLLDMRKERAARSSTPAYILTVGHNAISSADYYAMMQKDVVDQATQAYDFKIFFSGGIEYPVKRIIFAAMAGVDLALLELPVTLEELAEKKIHGFKISSHEPREGQAVQALGYPGDLIVMKQPPEFKLVSDKGTSLRTRNIELIMNKYVRFNYNAHVDMNCSAIEGMSGGPVLNLADKTVVGLVATAGVFEFRETTNSYQPVWHLGEAFDANGVVTADAFSNHARLCEKLLNTK